MFGRGFEPTWAAGVLAVGDAEEDFDAVACETVVGDLLVGVEGQGARMGEGRPVGEECGGEEGEEFHGVGGRWV